MLLNMLMLWILYIFSVTTFSTFRYFIILPVPSLMDYSEFFRACMLGAFVLSPVWLLLIWVISHM
ncbi:uncharacterized protein BT62DRAFT_928921, partial [Guyanagaster necrorhizus]